MTAGPAARAVALLADRDSWWDGLLGRYRRLHAHPELSMAEHRTAADLAEWLRRAGFEVTEGVGGTGVVGVLRRGPGPTVLLRGDLDALPVAETSGLPHASRRTAMGPSGTEVPTMHACGHDVHVVCLAGVAEVLAAGDGHWSGTLVVCGQPGEETAEGARAMVQDGLYTRFPRPDVCLAQHVSSAGQGIVEHRAGVFMSGAASIEITVNGRGAHAAQPEAAIDPVLIAAHLVTRLQSVVSRETPAAEPAVLTVSMIRAGDQHNVIPDRASVVVNLRARTDERKARLIEAVQRIARAECAAAGTPEPPSFRRFADFPVLVNDPALTAAVAAIHGELLGTRVEQGYIRMGSEDFSEFGLPGTAGTDGPPIPLVYWCFGLTDASTWGSASGDTLQQRMTTVPVAHTGDFVPRDPDGTIRQGVALLLAAALRMLGPAPASGTSTAPFPGVPADNLGDAEFDQESP